MFDYSNFAQAGVDPNIFLWLPVFGLSIALLAVWSLFWKGLALWHAARRGQSWWFIIMLGVNTAGILEMVYLFAILKLKVSELFSNK